MDISQTSLWHIIVNKVILCWVWDGLSLDYLKSLVVAITYTTITRRKVSPWTMVMALSWTACVSSRQIPIVTMCFLRRNKVISRQKAISRVMS